LIGIEIKLGDEFFLNIDFRENFIFNVLLNEISVLFIIGLNLRYEIPLLNSKINKIIKKQKLLIFNFFNNNLFGKFSGNSIIDFKDFIFSRNKINIDLFYYKFNYSIFNFKNRILNFNFSFGLNFIKNSNYFLKFLLENIFINYLLNIKCNILLSNLTYLNLFEIGLKVNKKRLINLDFGNSFFFLYNVDNEVFLNKFIKNNVNRFITYFGSFFDIGAKISNLIFPLNLFFEYNGLFLNFEGKLRKSFKIINLNIFNPTDLLKSLYIYINLKFLKVLFLFNNVFKILKYFKNLIIY